MIQEIEGDDVWWLPLEQHAIRQILNELKHNRNVKRLHAVLIREIASEVPFRFPNITGQRIENKVFNKNMTIQHNDKFPAETHLAG